MKKKETGKKEKLLELARKIIQLQKEYMNLYEEIYGKPGNKPEKQGLAESTD